MVKIRRPGGKEVQRIVFDLPPDIADIFRSRANELYGLGKRGGVMDYLRGLVHDDLSSICEPEIIESIRPSKQSKPRRDTA